MKYNLIIKEEKIKDVNSSIKIGKNCMIYMDYINNNFIIPIEKENNNLYYLENKKDDNERDTLLKLSWDNI